MRLISDFEYPINNNDAVLKERNDEDNKREQFYKDKVDYKNLIEKIHSFSVMSKACIGISTKLDTLIREYGLYENDYRVLNYNFGGFISNLVEINKNAEEFLVTANELNSQDIHNSRTSDNLSYENVLPSRIKEALRVSEKIDWFLRDSKMEYITTRVLCWYIDVLVVLKGNFNKADTINRAFSFRFTDDKASSVVDLRNLCFILSDSNCLEDFKIVEAQKRREKITSFGNIATPEHALDYYISEGNIKDRLDYLIASYYNYLDKKNNPSKCIFKKHTNPENIEEIVFGLKKCLEDLVNISEGKLANTLLRECLEYPYDLDDEMSEYGVIGASKKINSLVVNRYDALNKIISGIECLSLEGELPNIEDDINVLLESQNMIVEILKTLFLGRSEVKSILDCYSVRTLSSETCELLKEAGINVSDATMEHVRRYVGCLLQSLVLEGYNKLMDTIKKEEEEKRESEKRR